MAKKDRTSVQKVSKHEWRHRYWTERQNFRRSSFLLGGGCRQPGYR